MSQGKGCGFVQFVLRTAAERAMSAMNAQVLGSSAMRISWGRSSSRVANQAQQQGGMAGPHFGGMHGAVCETACTRGESEGSRAFRLCTRYDMSSVLCGLLGHCT
jgi:hypothetical protein